MTPAQRIYNLLSDMEPRTVFEIAEETGLLVDYVRGTVANLRMHKRVKVAGVQRPEPPRVGTAPKTYTVTGAGAPRGYGYASEVVRTTALVWPIVEAA